MMDTAAEESPATPPEDAWIFPTSFAQRRLWFLDQVEPGTTLYNVPGAYRIRGHADAGLLEKSFSELVARHEILRTTFRAVEGEPMQIVSERAEFHLPVIDLTGLKPEGREGEIARLIRAESEQPFDLGQGPLVRAALAEVGPAEQVLILGLHHILTDSWSQEILMRELTTIYAALKRGQAPALPEMPIQYADFASWQREMMRGEALDKATAFWRGRLEGLAPLALPEVAKHGGRHPGAEGDACAFELPAALTTRLRSLAQQEGVTLFMALLGAWQAFLARLTGQTDIAVGSPISHRSRTETEGLIGLFLNTIVLRTDLAHNPTVGEMLRRVRQTTLEAFAHQDLPFEMMVEDLQPARLAGRNPLLRVMFVLMSGEEKSWTCPGAVFEPLAVEESKPKFDLMLHLRDNGRTIRGLLVFDKAVFDGGMVSRMASHFQNLLGGMVAHPESKLESLPLATPEERDRVVRVLNGVERPFPADRTVHGLFQDQARLHPEAVAIEDGAELVSYAELDRRAEGVRAALEARGVKRGDAVAICLGRSANLIAGILGILKTGAAYVPLDLSYPAGRLELMLREGGAKVTICGEESPAPAGPAALSMAECLRAEPLRTPAPEGAGTDGAYIMFTSGSTGEPKGARILHRGISRLVINTDYVQFTPADVVAHASNTSFDASTFEIWGALLNGARLAIVPRETLLEARELVAFLQERKVSVLFLTTPLFHHFAREMPGGFGSLRYLVVGGDALQPQAARAVLEAGAPGHLVNGYGPTEATTFAICQEVAEVRADAASIPIGRPIANSTAYILDPLMQPAPIGITGELYLGGPGVAGGYLNRPELTAERFVADPFSTEAGARLYRTGDLARWREDGTIDFLGRADGQVKIRGFRVEPGEIEAALHGLPEVKEAIVTARLDGTGQKQLVAYVVARTGMAQDAAGLRQRLLEVLPEYMVPGAMGFVSALPLNANGKVDFAALEECAVLETRAAHEGPGTWMEASMTGIWEDILGRTGIGVTDDFFDLGGHSLLAIRMLAEVEKKTGIKVPPRLLFEGATIRHLATASRRAYREKAAAIVQVQGGGARAPFFFLHGDFVEGGLYCVKMARQIGGERPFYAIDPHGVHDTPRSIEEMAAQHLRLVREAQPKGPYVLGGFCNGGLVAFEMARQLEAAGERVASLILLSVDGMNVKFAWLKNLIGITGEFLKAPSDRRFRSFLQWRERILFARAAWAHQRQVLSTLEPARQGRHVARKTARVARKLVQWLLPRRAAAEEENASMLPESCGEDIGRIYQEACMAYVPRRFHGPADVLWPEKMPLEDPAAGWRKAIPQVRVHKIPGGHFSALQGENLRVLSEKIRECLLACDA